MTSLTFYGGVNEIGGNKILLEDKDTKVFLDFGKSFGRRARYFEEFINPRTSNGITDFLTMGLVPDISGVYRDDLRVMAGRKPQKPEIDAVLLSHAHSDHADTHFESIYSLKWYFHFLSSILCDQKVVMFSNNYIKFQMLFFLFWHKISGLQLSNLKNPSFYYSKFFEVQPARMFDDLPLSQIHELERKRFKEIAFLYLSYDKALDTIKSKQKFSNIEINQSSLPLKYQKNFQDVKVKCSSFLFVKKWYEFISNVQIRYYESQDYKKIPMKYKMEFIDDESINLRDNKLTDIKQYSKRIVKSLI